MARRKASALAPEQTLPSMESSLDAFIANAHAQTHEDQLDLTAFDAEGREQALRRELEAVQQRLAEAEARAAVAGKRSARSWVGIAAAFIVGSGTMYAVNSMANRPTEHASQASPALTQAATAEPTHPPAPPPSAERPAASASSEHPVASPPDGDAARPSASVEHATPEPGRPRHAARTSPRPTPVPAALPPPAAPVAAAPAPEPAPVAEHKEPRKEPKKDEGLYDPFQAHP